jgi:hypothetical protein
MLFSSLIQKPMQACLQRNGLQKSDICSRLLFQTMIGIIPKVLFYKSFISYFKKIYFSNPNSISLCKQALLAMFIKFYRRSPFILENMILTDLKHCVEF